MKNIYIIDEFSSSKVNGIGTYIRELTYCLNELQANVTRICFNSEVEKFTIVYEKNMTKFLFPKIPGYCFSHHKIISFLLKLNIEDLPDNLFIVNHFPCKSFLNSLKKTFPLSKTAFVIHDMSWTYNFLGDTEAYKKVIFSGDEIVDQYNDILSAYQEESEMYQMVDKVIILAKDTEKLLKDIYHIDDKKIFFVPNGLRDTYTLSDENRKKKIKNELHIDPNEKIILYAGRVNKIKGIYNLINAFKKILESCPNCRLVIAGTLFELNKTLKYSSELAAKITYTGQISSERIKDWYQIADVGILASFYEQCSYAGIEMLMYGLPVVASDGFCVKDMFHHNVNAQVAEIGDRDRPDIYEEKLANGVLQVLNSFELQRILKENSRKMYKSNYTTQLMQHNYQELLLSI